MLSVMIPPTSISRDKTMKARNSLKIVDPYTISICHKNYLVKSHHIERHKKSGLGGPGHLDFWSHCDIFQNLTRHGDSLAPPTQPKRPEKKRLKGALLMKMVNDDKHDDEEEGEREKREIEKLMAVTPHLKPRVMTEYVQNISPSTNLAMCK